MGVSSALGRGSCPAIVSCCEEIDVNRFAFVAVVSALLLSACNTIHGVGKDIEKGGQAIEKAAR